MKGEEILEKIKEISLKEDIRLAEVTASALSMISRPGCFKTLEKKYDSNDFKGNFEIVSLTGTINTMDGCFTPISI